jgi:hypothetical protein
LRQYQIFKKKIMHISNPPPKKRKRKRKKLFKVALQDKEKIFPKTIWKNCPSEIASSHTHPKSGSVREQD